MVKSDPAQIVPLVAATAGRAKTDTVAIADIVDVHPAALVPEIE